MRGGFSDDITRGEDQFGSQSFQMRDRCIDSLQTDSGQLGLKILC